VLGNTNLRAQLSARGMQRAATFSWEATARIILGVYRSVLQRNHRFKEHGCTRTTTGYDLNVHASVPAKAGANLD
jgi:hypothetical protein